MDDPSEDEGSIASISSASEVGVTVNIRRRVSTGPPPEKRRKSPRAKASNAQKPPPPTQLPKDLDALKEMMAELGPHLKGTEYDSRVSARVICAALTMQMEYCDLQKKKGKGAVIPKPKIRETIGRLFHVSPSTYSKIIKNFLLDRSIYEKTRGGNSNTPVNIRIPPTKENVILVRDFVRDFRLQRKRVTAVQVTHYLIEKHILQVPEDAGEYQKKDFRTALRCVQRFLVRMGYLRGKKKGIRPKTDVIEKRDVFLKKYIGNSLLPPEQRLREVYTDESYVHHHYKWKEGDSIYDPSDELGIPEGKEKHKGDRYCFITAIQGAAPLQRGLISDKAGMVPNSEWYFCPTRKSDHKGDYHKVFNGSNFVAWFRNQLLPNLNDPSLIILDNAKYHAVYGEGVPKAYKAKSPELKEYLSRVGVAYDENDSQTLLRKKAAAYIKEFEEIEIERLANLFGHEILWTPPYYSDLQPIELVWAWMKGAIGRQYDIDTTLALVGRRLIEQFDRLQTLEGEEYIEKVINKCYNRSKVLWEKIRAADDAELAANNSDLISSSEDEEQSGIDSSSDSDNEVVGL
eukprot:scaffold1057_cov154-Amphora_coffeaeformis.AAC.5